MEKSTHFYEELTRKRSGEHPELKHLSKGRKRNQRDSVSKRRANAEQPKPCRKTMGLQGRRYEIEI